MLVSLNEVLFKAREQHYAVGLFNTVNLEMARGVLQAAEELRSPVIIGTAEILLPYASLEELALFLLPMARSATVPVVVHFDHGLTEEKIERAIELGFSSVMYDCSTQGFEENCRRVAGMVQRAHAANVTVEAELGHVGSNDGTEGGEDERSLFTLPEEAVRFCEKTGVDALAVAIGTAHGAYKQAPKLDFERLDQIALKTPVPLVLHGGSGLSDEDFKAAIAGGISKINIFTDLNCAAADAARENYIPGHGLTDLMLPVTAAVKEATMKKMQLFGSVNRA